MGFSLHDHPNMGACFKTERLKVFRSGNHNSGPGPGFLARLFGATPAPESPAAPSVTRSYQYVDWHEAMDSGLQSDILKHLVLDSYDLAESPLTTIYDPKYRGDEKTEPGARSVASLGDGDSLLVCHGVELVVRGEPSGALLQIPGAAVVKRKTPSYDGGDDRLEFRFRTDSGDSSYDTDTPWETARRVSRWIAEVSAVMETSDRSGLPGDLVLQPGQVPHAAWGYLDAFDVNFDGLRAARPCSATAWGPALLRKVPDLEEAVQNMKDAEARAAEKRNFPHGRRWDQ